MPSGGPDGIRGVLSDDAELTTGDGARATNLAAARAVADAVRTTLGPQGMDKMLVDDSGDVVVTNDGVTLLEEMDVSHPTAGLMIEVARTQDAEVGDGTTSAVVLAGELLDAAGELLDRGVHPTTVAAGYDHAATVADRALAGLAADVEPGDAGTLRRIAETAMTGKGAEAERERLAEMVVEAVRTATDGAGRVDRDAIQIRTFPGGSVPDSRLIPGALLDYDPPNASMPTSMAGADVLVYGGDLEVDELEVDAEAAVGSFEAVADLVDREEGDLSADVERILDVGADVVLVDGGIDDRAQGLFARNDVLALRRVSEDDRARVAAATGATPVGHLSEVEPGDLGHAGDLRQEQIRDYGLRVNSPKERTLVFDDGDGGEIATLLLRGGTEHVLDEVERAVEDSVAVVAAAVEDGSVLPGGGAAEIEVAAAVRDAADGVAGREQLAVEAFADAFEVGPRILAENAGTSPIDALTALRAAHDDGRRNAGLDGHAGGTVDAVAAGVVEPYRVKATAVAAAVEVATAIVRIDDVVAADGLAAGGDGGDADDGGEAGDLDPL